MTLTIQEGLTVRKIILVGPPQADPLLAPNLILAALVTKEGQPYSDDGGVVREIVGVEQVCLLFGSNLD